MAKFGLKLIAFLFALLAIGEVITRLDLVPDPVFDSWYRPLAKKLPHATHAVVFIGQSKTTAAIDASVISEVLRKHHQQNVMVFNAGIPYSTLVEQYFALRNTARLRGNLKNVVVVVEASNGYPDTQTWRSAWFNPHFAALCDPLLTLDDLKRMWSTSGDSMRDKTFVTLGCVLRSVRDLQISRMAVLHVPSTYLFKQDEAASLNDITGIAGEGLSSDPDFLRTMRQGMKDGAIEFKRSGLPVKFSKDDVFCSIVDLVRENQGLVCTFTPPQSSYDIINAKYSNPEEYNLFCREHNVIALKCKVDYTDEDFPDYAHVNRRTRRLFSAQLAEVLSAYLQAHISDPTR